MKQPHISPGSSVDTHSNKPIPFFPPKNLHKGFLGGKWWPISAVERESCWVCVHPICIKPTGTYRTFPWRAEFLWNALPAPGKAPYGQGKLGERLSLSGAPSTFKGKYLDSALEGAKLMKKSTGKRKNHREEHNNALKIHKQAVLHVQEEQKGCYQLKGDQRIFRLDVGNIFYPRPPWLCLCRLPGDAVEPPSLPGSAWAEREQHTELSHPGAVLPLLQVSPTSALSQIKQEECIMTFSQISGDVVSHPPLCFSLQLHGSCAPALICIQQTQNCSVELSKPAFKATLTKDKKLTEHPTEILTEKAVSFPFHTNRGWTGNIGVFSYLSTHFDI